MAKLTIACLQLEALGLAQAEQALDRALAMVDAAGAQHPDLMILPECTYPAYFLESLESYHRAKVRPHEEVIRLFREGARKHRCHLVVGIAAPISSAAQTQTRLMNSAFLFDPQGQVIGTYSKSFLWHFDQVWFEPGREFPTFDLPFGRTGIFVCADGRMPEIARLLGVKGSRLMVDPTAWVTNGGDRATLSNPQFEYMIPTRAIENKAWIAVANKVGVEAETIVYCGRSCVVSPEGKVVVQASPAKEEIVTAVVDLDEAGGIPIRRRPECYGVLREPTERLPASRTLNEPIVPTSTRVGLLQLRPYETPDAWLRRVGALVETLVQQGAALIVLPGIPAAFLDAAAYQSEHTLRPLLELSRRLGCGLACPLVCKATDGRRRLSVYLLHSGEVIGSYDQVHIAGEQWSPGDVLPVFDTPYGRLGIMQGDEGLLPEVTRALMLKGADLVLWPASTSRFPLRVIARTRADENKVFIALATPLEENVVPQSALVSPAGAFIATSLPDIEQGIAGQIAWALARYKEMAPNTNVVLSRQPAAYDGIETAE